VRKRLKNKFINGLFLFFCFIVLLIPMRAMTGGCKMISSNQVMEIASTAIKNHQYHDKPGDIVVERKKEEYQVTFDFVIPNDGGNKWADYVIELLIDAKSGKVLKMEDKGISAISKRIFPDARWKSFISGKRAYEVSLNAIKGYENYDITGRLTIELKQDVYHVTFPLMKAGESGSRSADYAKQIWVDAQSGKVLKIRAAS